MIQSRFTLTDRSIPVIATAIHNGHRIPEELQPYTCISEGDRLREEDPYTGRIAEQFPNHIVVDTSRFAVDLNRSRENAVYRMPEDAWGLTVRTAEFPKAMVEELLKSYDAWYNILCYELEHFFKLHPFVIVLDLHSFNHRRGGQQAEPDPQAENPDIILGRSNMPNELYPLVDDLKNILEGKPFRNGKLDVRIDVKFTGGYLSRFLHSKYPGRLICPAIEFKKIFMDEWNGTLDPRTFFDLRKFFYAACQEWIPKVLSQKG
nr:N-formylglutamate deformylase [Candidatus Cloacimonadota bacterium]